MNKETFITEGTKLIKYTGKGGNVVIPDGITEIGKSAFCRAGIYSITMPSSVTKLANEAITDCFDLEEIIFSDNITNITNNFNHCHKLTTIKLPSELRKIGYSFINCQSLKNIFLGKNLESVSFCFVGGEKTKSITADDSSPYLLSENGCLYNKSKDTLMVYYSCEKEFIVPDTVKRIGIGTFFTSPVRKIYMNDNVEKIGACAFEDCTELTEIRLSESLRVLPLGMLSGCIQLREIHIPKNIECIDSHALNFPAVSLSIPAPKYLGGGFFDRVFNTEFDMKPGDYYKIMDKCIFTTDETVLVAALPDFDLKSYTVPSSVEQIDVFAFQCCNALEEIFLPEGLRQIKYSAFLCSSNLKKVYFGNNNTEISETAFEGCEAAEYIMPE